MRLGCCGVDACSIAVAALASPTDGRWCVASLTSDVSWDIGVCLLRMVQQLSGNAAIALHASDGVGGGGATVGSGAVGDCGCDWCTNAGRSALDSFGGTGLWRTSGCAVLRALGRSINGRLPLPTLSALACRWSPEAAAAAGVGYAGNGSVRRAVCRMDRCSVAAAQVMMGACILCTAAGQQSLAALLCAHAVELPRLTWAGVVQDRGGGGELAVVHSRAAWWLTLARCCEHVYDVPMALTCLRCVHASVPWLRPSFRSCGGVSDVWPVVHRVQSPTKVVRGPELLAEAYFWNGGDPAEVGRRWWRRLLYCGWKRRLFFCRCRRCGIWQRWCCK
jgi:hypothetical protein